MTYYRLMFNKDENGVSFSEIIEQTTDSRSFLDMSWDKPIIRHFDGKYLHFVALDRQYLECMLAGIAALQEMSTIDL